jgi:hypothetical protein
MSDDMKRIVIVITALVGIAGISCTRMDTVQPTNLKSSLEKNVATVNTAISQIQASDAYKLIASAGATEKCYDSHSDSITLDLISGIYTYLPDTTHYCRHSNDFKLFKKTGESDSLIVHLPASLAFNPSSLVSYSSHYRKLNSDFTIIATDYHCYYNFLGNLDYKLYAGFFLGPSDLGTLSVLENVNNWKDQYYSSEYNFTEGYSISTLLKVGDTVTREFALRDETDTLLRETMLFIPNGTCHAEKQYTLSIGNIDIKKTSGIDSIQVFLDGVLQQNAAAVIVDSTGTDDGSICYHHRDILITFDDGTTVKLSELLDPVLDQLGEIVDSLRSMSFAKHVIDYIAFNVYYSRQWFYDDLN